MNKPTISLFIAGLISLTSLTLPSTTISAQTLGATGLLQKHAAISPQLAQNPFRRPLVIESSEAKNSVTGNAYAIIDAPFPTVNGVLKDPDRWCDVLMLHPNTKACSAVGNLAAQVLVLHVGKKTPQQLKDASRLDFSYRQTALTTSYAAAELNAEQGPLGTRNYRIEMETAPLPDGKTFMHLRYGYSYGAAAKFAMQGYLATVAAGKVGFSPSAESSSELVGGARGAVERNTMRYYLAIEAYLASRNVPEAHQESVRLSRWFDSSEQYARQLHEITKTEYMAMKRDEFARLQSR